MRAMIDRSTGRAMPAETEPHDRDTLSDSIEQLELSTSIDNHCGEDLVVATRLGLNYTLPQSRSRSKRPSVHITVRVVTSTRVKVNSCDILNASGEESHLVTKLMEDYHDRPTRQRDSNFGRVAMEAHCQVSRETLLSSGGTVYLRDLDVVIAVKRLNANPIHPMTIPEDIMRSTDGLEAKATFRLIDNEGTIGQLYLNINGEVFDLIPESSSDLKSGLYYTANSAHVRKGRNISEHQTTYFSPAELMQKDNRPGVLKFIFTNPEQAKHFGDVIAEREKQHKETALQLKLETTALAAEAERQKHALREAAELTARKEEEHKAELEKQKREMEYRYNINSMDRKDYYENRTYNRKDSSEWLKFVPAVLSLGAVLIPLLRS